MNGDNFSQIDRLVTQQRELTSRVHTKLDEFQAKQTDLNNRKIEEEKLNRQLTEQNAEIDSKKSQIDRLTEEDRLAQAQLANCENLIQLTVSDVRAKDAAKNDLIRTRNEEQLFIEYFTNNLATEKSELTTIKSEIRRLKTEQGIVSSNYYTNEGEQNALKFSIQCIEAQNSNLMADIAQQQREVDKLSSEIEDLIRQRESERRENIKKQIQVQIDEKQKKLNNAQSSLNTKVLAFDKNEAAVREKREALIRAEGQGNDLRHQALRLNSELNDSVERKEAVENNVEQYAEELANHKRAHNVATTAIDRLEWTIQDLSRYKEDIDRQKSLQMTQKEGIKTKLDALILGKTDLETKKQVLEKQISQISADQVRLNSEVQTLQSHISQIQSGILVLQHKEEQRVTQQKSQENEAAQVNKQTRLQSQYL